METAMIISMDDYRRIDKVYDSGADSDRQAYVDFGNTVPKLQLATVESELQDSPNLPAAFYDFNAKEFIERAYTLATQI